jgi:hypothetical protein
MMYSIQPSLKQAVTVKLEIVTVHTLHFSSMTSRSLATKGRINDCHEFCSSLN